ncbi:unnamed protein product [Schistocephalus solidus]|uniref:PAS domain-containing protein n=1 Tax=Schistocephalus solidus TaxID=70667 RepID=A0A183SYK5_SCHSO|nr:unnamed protein product [Schistocephalus solidus]
MLPVLGMTLRFAKVSNIATITKGPLLSDFWILPLILTVTSGIPMLQISAPDTSLYSLKKDRSRCECQESAVFDVGPGVHQGCLLPIPLLNNFIDRVLKHASADHSSIAVGENPCTISLIYADEVAVLGMPYLPLLKSHLLQLAPIHTVHSILNNIVCQTRTSAGARRGFICRLKLGISSHPNCNSASAAARQARLRHQQYMLSSLKRSPEKCGGNNGFHGPTPPQQPYALVHVTGFVKNWPLNSGAAPTAATPIPLEQYSNHSSMVLSLLDGLSTTPAPREGDAIANGVTGPNRNSAVDGGSPQFFVGLARLQLTNLPQAGDLTPHRAHEFITRLNEDGCITFCDQRVANVLLSATPSNLLGRSFAELVSTSEDQAAFSEIFADASKGKGQEYKIALHLRLDSEDPVAVRCCLSAFLNPYSEEVEYIVCTVVSMKALQAAASVVTAAPVSDAYHSFPGGASFAMLPYESLSSHQPLLTADSSRTGDHNMRSLRPVLTPSAHPSVTSFNDSERLPPQQQQHHHSVQHPPHQQHRSTPHRFSHDLSVPVTHQMSAEDAYWKTATAPPTSAPRSSHGSPLVGGPPPSMDDASGLFAHAPSMLHNVQQNYPSFDPHDQEYLTSHCEYRENRLGNQLEHFSHHGHQSSGGKVVHSQYSNMNSTLQPNYVNSNAAYLPQSAFANCIPESLQQHPGADHSSIVSQNHLTEGAASPRTSSATATTTRASAICYLPFPSAEDQVKAEVTATAAACASSPQIPRNHFMRSGGSSLTEVPSFQTCGDIDLGSSATEISQVGCGGSSLKIDTDSSAAAAAAAAAAAVFQSWYVQSGGPRAAATTADTACNTLSAAPYQANYFSGDFTAPPLPTSSASLLLNPSLMHQQEEEGAEESFRPTGERVTQPQSSFLCYLQQTSTCFNGS